MKFSIDEEIAIQDALHSWWDEYLDDELENDGYDEPEHEGEDSLNDPPI